MSRPIGDLKAALRRRLLSTAKLFSDADRVAASEQIRDILRAHPVWQAARAVLFYAPMPQEPDLWPLAPEALAAGKTVALPRYLAAEDHYQVCRIINTASDLRLGHYGIIEPVADCALFPANKLDLALVPGVGFALNGCRLGRGKGYYDRLLAQVPGCKCGIAFEWQVTVDIPMDAHDILLDCILTPARWYQVTGAGRS